MVLQQSSCVGPVPDYSVVFVSDIAGVNSAIANCVGPNKPGKLQQPSTLESVANAQAFIHVTYNCDIMGFIDDVYMSTSQYSASETLVQIQS